MGLPLRGRTAGAGPVHAATRVGAVGAGRSYAPGPESGDRPLIPVHRAPSAARAPRTVMPCRGDVRSDEVVGPRRVAGPVSAQVELDAEAAAQGGRGED